MFVGNEWCRCIVRRSLSQADARQALAIGCLLESAKWGTCPTQHPLRLDTLFIANTSRMSSTRSHEKPTVVHLSSLLLHAVFSARGYDGRRMEIQTGTVSVSQHPFTWPCLSLSCPSTVFKYAKVQMRQTYGKSKPRPSIPLSGMASKNSYVANQTYMLVNGE